MNMKRLCLTGCADKVRPRKNVFFVYRLAKSFQIASVADRTPKSIKNTDLNSVQHGGHTPQAVVVDRLVIRLSR